MSYKPTYQNTGITNYILNVVGGILLSILGIQITTLVLLPVRIGDKRFNQ